MTGLRPLAQTLTEVAEGAMAAAAQTGVRATRIELDLPIEISFGGTEFRADLPRFVTRTAFDLPVSRLRIVWEMPS